MKRNLIYITLLVASALASCSKDDGPVVPEGPVDATLTLSLFAGAKPTDTKAFTKADDDQEREGEAKINTIQAALFKPDGSLLAAHYLDENAMQAQDKDTIGVSAKSGKHTLVILVNAGNPEYTTLDQLKAATTTLRSQGQKNLAMSSTCIEVDIKAGANYIGPKDYFGGVPIDATFLNEEHVCVTRLVGRLDFEKLTVDWNPDKAQDLIDVKAGFKLKRIFVKDSKEKTRLISGTTTTTIDAEDWSTVEYTADDAVFMNGMDEGGANYLKSLNLFTHAGDLIANKGEKEWSSALTCYVTENGMNEEAFPTPTCLILKGDIVSPDGSVIMKDRYYTIVVNDQSGVVTGGDKFWYVKRNYVYHIQATIDGKGSEVIDKLSNASITVEVTVKPWTIISEDHPDVN